MELEALLSVFGYNDALTINDNNVTINTNGETETLIWDSAAMDFTVDVDMFQNGTQNMYSRTVNDGSRDVTVLVDADGKAIQAPTLGGYTNVLFTVGNYGNEIDTVTEGDTLSREGIINACGGSVNITALDAGNNVFLLVMGSHIQYCSSVDSATYPVVTEWIRPVNLYWLDNWIVNEEGAYINLKGSWGGIYNDNGEYKLNSNFPSDVQIISVQGGENYEGLYFEYNGITYQMTGGSGQPSNITPNIGNW